MTLQHLTAAAEPCSATPHTPKGVVVQQMHCHTCRTSAAPKVQQVQQIWNRSRTLREMMRMKGTTPFLIAELFSSRFRRPVPVTCTCINLGRFRRPVPVTCTCINLGSMSVTHITVTALGEHCGGWVRQDAGDGCSYDAARARSRRKGALRSATRISTDG